jgi:alpha-1,3-rhamnosyltransferase
MNKDNPKVTVRMSAYNHEQYVEQAILSIVNQTFQNFELLVIDDGSSDRTPEILERLSQDHGFYFERQQNMGLPKTLNKLIAMAKGEYVTGCASDDYWPKARLEEQVDVLDDAPSIDMVHSKVTVVDNDGAEIKLRGCAKPFVNGRNQFVKFIMHKLRYFSGTAMIRKEVFNRIGGYHEGIAVEDFEWWMRACRKLDIQFVDTVWTYYRHHPNNWLKTPSGALKGADSHYVVAKELGWRYGCLFLMTMIPSLFYWECTAGRKRRFFYLLFLPILFWNTRFLKIMLIAVLGYAKMSRLKTFCNSYKLAD